MREELSEVERPEEPKPVAEAVQSLERAINENGNLVEMLEGKLRPALAQEVPVNSSDSAAKNPRHYSSDLASVLFELAARVRSINGHIGNIKDRVEL